MHDEPAKVFVASQPVTRLASEDGGLGVARHDVVVADVVDVVVEADREVVMWLIEKPVTTAVRVAAATTPPPPHVISVVVLPSASTSAVGSGFAIRPSAAVVSSKKLVKSSWPERRTRIFRVSTVKSASSMSGALVASKTSVSGL